MIDYKLFLDCVHCGLCTSACPTYLERGDENDGPRGRIYLMRAVTDGRIAMDENVRGHLELCLDCRACETACPSGVQYGQLIESFREQIAKSNPPGKQLGWLTRLVLFGITPHAKRLRLALNAARIMQLLQLDWLIEKSGLLRLTPTLAKFHEILPRLQRRPPRLPELLPAEGRRRARVALFTGCASDGFFPETTVATARVLQKNGCEVWIPPTQVCCGALHYHAGQQSPACNFASVNCDVFGAELQALDAIIVNAAGCGVMLKDYHHLLPDRGNSFAGKVMDLSEFLVKLGPVPPEHPVSIKAVYHDACHMCHGQQIRSQPRQLLNMVPGLELLSLAESEICCGAAGSYNLTQPEMADQLGRRKANHILHSGAQAVITGNVGCILQIARHLRSAKPAIRALHFADVLWASYNKSSHAACFASLAESTKAGSPV